MGNSVVQSLLPLFLVAGAAFGSIDHCRNRTFDNIVNKNLLHFSKENSEKEFAVVDGFKSLHCCSHGYRSIEWFKDGVPYPWSTDVSTLIISPESGNQTIYSQGIAEIDSGGYWCIVRNDTHSLRHDVMLKVSGSSDLEDPPKPTYRPKDQHVELGQRARFYCEAFVGNINLPDAKSEISWRKAGVNSSVFDQNRIKQHIITRQGNQVLGSYLFISDVKTEDYGLYVCRVSNTGDQFLDLNASLIEEDKTASTGDSDESSEGTILLIILLILSATVSTISLVKFGSHFKLMYHRLFKSSNSKKIKEFDLLVVYNASDRDIAMNKIVFTLQEGYHYVCSIESISYDNLLDCKIIAEKAGFSKRLIVLLSPSITDNEWSCYKLGTALEKLISVHPRIIVILLKPLPFDNSDCCAGLKDLLRRVYCVEYSETRRFWDLLTLGLPAPGIRSDNQPDSVRDSEIVELV